MGKQHGKGGGKTHAENSGNESGDTLEQKIQAAAQQAGITEDDCQRLAGNSTASGADAAKFGDGVLLGKFLELFKLLMPIILPILIGKEGESHTQGDE